MGPRNLTVPKTIQTELCEVIVYLRTVPTNSKVFLPRLMIMQEMLILTSAIEIRKENWG